MYPRKNKNNYDWRILMKTMKKFAVIAMLMIIVSGVTACGKEQSRGNSIGNLANGGYVAESDGWIIYAIEGSIYCAREDGSEKTAIYRGRNGDVSQINVMDGIVYFVENYSQCRVNMDGSGYECLIESDWDEKRFVYGSQLVGDWVYCERKKISVNDSQMDDIWTESADINKIGSTTCVTNKEIYNSQTDGIYKANLNGGAFTKISEDSAFELMVIGDWVYYTNNDAHLCRMKTNGSHMEQISKLPMYSVITDGEWIYGSDHKAIYKTKVSDMDWQIIAYGNANCLQLAGDWLYFKDKESDSMYLYRVKTDGTVSEEFASYGDV